MLKIRLNRDLRKSILRGHPWVYREAIQGPKDQKKACLCQVLDKKGQELAWAIYSAEGPLALRILSTEKKPPNQAWIAKKMGVALNFRRTKFDDETTAFRLFNGEGDGLPGLVCDVYGSLAVLQMDGVGPYQFWDQEWLAQWLLKSEVVKSVFLKPRKSDDWEGKFWGLETDLAKVEFKENGIRFLANIKEGQKTGFFLDQRDNRKYISEVSKSLSVLNLFSYTGGFSLYAGFGGAKLATSVDISKGALEMADQSWALNDFTLSSHKTQAKDVFAYLKESSEKWDMIIVDPPSMTHSEEQKNSAIKSYIEIFSDASRKVSGGGHLVLSSCSSHIGFEDFFAIIGEALSRSRRTGRIHRVSGQGADHPFPHFCHELRYLKFVHLTLD